MQIVFVIAYSIVLGTLSVCMLMTKTSIFFKKTFLIEMFFWRIFQNKFQKCISEMYVEIHFWCKFQKCILKCISGMHFMKCIWNAFLVYISEMYLKYISEMYFDVYFEMHIKVHDMHISAYLMCMFFFTDSYIYFFVKFLKNSKNKILNRINRTKICKKNWTYSVNICKKIVTQII